MCKCTVTHTYEFVTGFPLNKALSDTIILTDADISRYVVAYGFN